MRRAWVALAAASLVLAACGDDEEEAPDTAGSTTPAQTTDTGPPPETTTQPAQTETAPPEEQVPPEEQPGGAGDEEEIRTEAKLTGDGGRVTPAQVSVPPFIGVRIQLRSADADAYALRCAGRQVSADREIETASTTLPGQRPGTVVMCRPLRNHNGVRISFSAEPGP